MKDHFSGGRPLSHIGEIRSNSKGVAFLSGYRDVFGCRVELRGELFGILDFVNEEETQRQPGFIFTANTP